MAVEPYYEHDGITILRDRRGTTAAGRVAVTVAELIAWGRRVALALETPLCLDAYMGDDGTTPRDPHAVRERKWLDDVSSA